MQHFHKAKAVLALFVLGSIIFPLMLLVTINTNTNVSAVEASEVGVYWDSDCTDIVLKIDWETLEPGSLKSIPVYIRNEVEEPVYLRMSTEKWDPPKTIGYMTLRWNYAGQQMNNNESLQITLTLYVFPDIEGISSFSFDILITVSDRLLCDVNSDGVVNLLDEIIVSNNYGYIPPKPPECDVTGDGVVNIIDEITVSSSF